MAQGFLCRAWGETDFPEAALVQTREEIIAFIVSAQFGDTPLAELGEENRQIIEEQIAQMDLDVSSCDAKWEIEFEIGGIGVERCFFAATGGVTLVGDHTQAQATTDVAAGGVQPSGGDAAQEAAAAVVAQLPRTRQGEYLEEPMHETPLLFWLLRMNIEADGIDGYFKGSSYWSADGADAWGPGEICRWVYANAPAGATRQADTAMKGGA